MSRSRRTDMTRHLFLGTILLFAALPSQAGVIFSNLVQPGNQYGPDGVGIGHTPGFPSPGDYLLYGVHFIPSTTAQLTIIQAPLGVLNGPNQIQAFLMSDSGGSPGSILESFPLSNLPSRPVRFPGYDYIIIRPVTPGRNSILVRCHRRSVDFCHVDAEPVSR